MSVIAVNKDNFETEVLQSNIPVLVDFWADWCGPCKMFGPVVDQIAEEYEGKVKVCKINIDEEQALAEQYKIMSIPTVVVFKDGEAANTSVGVLSKSALEKLVN